MKTVRLGTIALLQYGLVKLRLAAVIFGVVRRQLNGMGSASRCALTHKVTQVGGIPYRQRTLSSLA